MYFVNISSLNALFPICHVSELCKAHRYYARIPASSLTSEIFMLLKLAPLKGFSLTLSRLALYRNSKSCSYC